MGEGESGPARDRYMLQHAGAGDEDGGDEYRVYSDIDTVVVVQLVEAQLCAQV